MFFVFYFFVYFMLLYLYRLFFILLYHFVYLCRCGFSYLELDHVPAGIYNVIPTTFLPKQEGHFFLDFGSATPLKVSHLQ